MANGDRFGVEDLLGGFDEHLRRTRGVCPQTRGTYAMFVRAFLDSVSVDGEVRVAALEPRQVIGFIGRLARRYRPGSVELAASALRSFFRALRAQGLRGDRLEDAVPMVPRRRSGGPARHLEAGRLEQLIGSLRSASPRDLRDRAMILCMARLALRASEVVRLCLDDIDWRNGVLHVRARKTGHGAMLPLSAEVGAAVADYLQHTRVETEAREVFVLLWLRPGAPISRSVVRQAVDRAVRHAGIAAPGRRGANLLRHSLATDLLRAGASLREIADLFGHRSPATTQIYAAVDIVALRQAGLPWPQVKS